MRRMLKKEKTENESMNSPAQISQDKFSELPTRKVENQSIDLLQDSEYNKSKNVQPIAKIIEPVVKPSGFCHFCGKPHFGFRFCPDCGTKLVLKELATKTQNAKRESASSTAEMDSMSPHVVAIASTPSVNEHLNFQFSANEKKARISTKTSHKKTRARQYPPHDFPVNRTKSPENDIRSEENFLINMEADYAEDIVAAEDEALENEYTSIDESSYAHDNTSGEVDEFVDRLDKVFERTVHRRHRREVLRRRKEKFLREQERKRQEDEQDLISRRKKSSISVRGLPPALSPNRMEQLKKQQMLHQLEELERRYEAQESRLKPKRPNGSNVMKSSPRRKYNSNGADTSMLLHGNGNPELAYPGAGSSRTFTHGASIKAAGNVQTEQLKKSQRRMEKMVRSGQHRAEVLQKLEFDLLRAEFAGSMESVSKQLAILEDREAGRSVHENAVNLSEKWWTEEEKSIAAQASMPCNRKNVRSKGKRDIYRSSPNASNSAMLLPPEDYEVNLARSKLQLLHKQTKVPSVRNKTLAAKKRISPTTREVYGTKKATLGVFNAKKNKASRPGKTGKRSNGRRLYM